LHEGIVSEIVTVVTPISAPGIAQNANLPFLPREAAKLARSWDRNSDQRCKKCFFTFFILTTFFIIKNVETIFENLYSPENHPVANNKEKLS